MANFNHVSYGGFSGYNPAGQYPSGMMYPTMMGTQSTFMPSSCAMPLCGSGFGQTAPYNYQGSGQADPTGMMEKIFDLVETLFSRLTERSASVPRTRSGAHTSPPSGNEPTRGTPTGYHNNEGANLSGQDLTQSTDGGYWGNFKNATLHNTNFSNGCLSNSDFTGASIYNSNFEGCNIMGLKFDPQGAQFGNNNFSNTDLSDVDFSQVSAADLRTCNWDHCSWSSTFPPKWPDGFTPPAHTESYVMNCQP